MGALHEGHLSLVREACRKSDFVVVSIFVNPTQFGPREDFKKYPRPESRDLDLLRNEGVDVVFLPRLKEMYRDLDETRVRPRECLSSILEGRFRPGHFEGVATVVLKLFRIVRPAYAFFGEKDFQQVRVIEGMVEDLFLDVQIKRCKTHRESSGLAMSSRNQYLSVEDRAAASEIYRQLVRARDPKSARRELRRLGFRIQYLEVWSPNLEKKLNHSSGRWLVAAIYKKVRLIDNLLRVRKK